LHVSPKNPEAQDSHEVPLKPGAQTHVLVDGEQIPLLEHVGLQVDDLISYKLSVVEERGSCDVSGTEDQTTTRSLLPLDPPKTAYILSARTNDPAVTCDGWTPSVPFNTGASEYEADPEYKTPLYKVIPGDMSSSRGKEEGLKALLAFSKPEKGLRVAPDEIRRS